MGATEDEMVGWHHQLSEHKFEQTLGDSEGLRSLACCSLWGCKEPDISREIVIYTDVGVTGLTSVHY